MRIVRSIVLALAACAPAAAQQGPVDTAVPATAPLPQVRIDWNVRIPLRDRVELAATVYRAVGADAPVPCVFTLTPYIAQSYHDRGMYFAAHGYVFLTVDARGRGNSGGRFTPLLQEARDGHDVVEWLARQPMCGGKVAMWGGSYAGYNQWATAREFPRGLGTIVPVASPYAGVDFPMSRNMFYPYDVQWLTLVFGKAAQDKVFGDSAYWTSLFKRLHATGTPFRRLDTLAGMPSETFQTWLAHPMPDAYWDAFNPTAAEYARIDLPILTITGHYDGDQPGALAHYRAHEAHAGAAARARHFLVIGPWDHAGTRTPRREVGGLRFGAASELDLNDLHRQWYDHALKGAARPAFLEDRVAWYITGAEEWRHSPTLDAVTAGRQVLHLDSDGKADRVFGGGRLVDAAPGDPGSDAFRHDPSDLSTQPLADAVDVPALTDQRAILLGDGRQLVYHTAPLARDTDLAGHFVLRAWIAIDQVDADVAATVYEVRPDGGSILLAGDQIRARHRRDPRREELAVPGAVERWDFDQFTFVARRIGKGSRLRLVLSPKDSPLDQRNYHVAAPVADHTPADARPVVLTLHHGGGRDSVLELPLAATPGR